MAGNDIQFRSYDFDRLEEGYKLKIEHTVYYDATDKGNDISDLITKSLSDLTALREESRTREQTAYEATRQAASMWEKEAAVSARLDKALEYLKTPEPKHTSNQWVTDGNGYKSISNRVYEMSYRVQEGYSRRGVPPKWEVRWFLYLNPSQKGYYSLKIAGQDKTYATKEEAEKYMNGRIKAYSNLFTEISPPIPDKYVNHFCVNGQLLRGYTTEAMQRENAERTEKAEKPSVRKQLDSLKNNVSAKKQPAKEHSQPELD